MNEEIKCHLDLEIEKNIERGMSPREARKSALLKFGGVEQVKENCRDSWGTRQVTGMIREFKLGMRLLLNNKGFTVAVTLTLGLCIGGNTIIYSVLNSLLSPPDYPEPNRVVEIYNSYPAQGIDRMTSNIPIYLDYSEHADSFEFLALVQNRAVNMTYQESSTRIPGIYASPDFFNLFDVHPVLGRFYGEESFVRDSLESRHVVVSESYWENQFNRDPSIIGETLYIDTQLSTIIGVAPASLSSHFGDAAFFHPWNWNPNRETEQALLNTRHSNRSRLYGRLKTGVTREQAKTQLDVIDARYYEIAPERMKMFLDSSNHETLMSTLRETNHENLGTSLYLLQGSVLLVLLIGCINVANLLIARSHTRLPEFAMRSSLGASNTILKRERLMECLALAAMSSFVGILIAWVGSGTINRYLLNDLLPSADNLSILSSVDNFVFISALSLAVGLFLGLFSSFSFTKKRLLAFIHESGGKASSSKPMRIFRSGLVATQLAFTIVLLVGSALLLQSFIKAINSDPGFETDDRFTTSVSLDFQNYGDLERTVAFRQSLETSLKTIPAVESVALSSGIPGITSMGVNTISIPGYEPVSDEGMPAFNVCLVNSGFFDLLGISFIQGRDFDLSDMNRNQSSIILDRNAAERYYPNGDAVGSYIPFGNQTEPENMSLIVGVVENIRHQGLDGENMDFTSGNEPMMYRHINANLRLPRFNIIIKSKRDFADIFPEIRENVAQLDSQIPLYFSGRLEDLLQDTLNDRRAFMFLTIILGVMALILSVIGIYGVLSYDISQRTNEIGLRMAIGASPKNVLGLFFGQGARKVGIGIALGIIGAIFFSNRLRSFLFEIEPTSFLSFVTVAIFVSTIASIAIYIPAASATRIKPMVALRTE
ncbi:MAG: ADOP family duplicated permease [Opitutales bacterium]|nr:ADOP family duplicated permease [Opitutales bacterium]